MRRTAALALLLSLAYAADDAAPTCRCVLASRPAGLTTVADTGLPELDKRIASEASFLENLYKIDADLVLLGGEPARKAFTVIGADGKATVFVSASWLSDVWQEDNRVATVAAILAHQHAHVLQAKRKCTLSEWSREKQADLLAGWYLGKRNIATLGSGSDLDNAFATSLYQAPDDFLNARFDHGDPAARVTAIRKGFFMFREERQPIDKVFKGSLAMFPRPNEGLADGVGKPAGAVVRVKVECLHKGPCGHQVACTHPQPCVHKVSCKHESPCVHKTPCVHREACTHAIPCVHKTRCVHRTRCQHHVSCVHTVPCTHYDSDGNPKHAYDYLHNFDYEHEYDYEHEWDYEHKHDYQHEFDIPHEFDTEHPFDPIHEFDMAHEWDPIHEFDLAHEWDPLHDYDVRFVPAEDAGGASGAK